MHHYPIIIADVHCPEIDAFLFECLLFRREGGDFAGEHCAIILRKIRLIAL